MLAGITQALGAERINIEDFELGHMSPERGGTLSVLVTGEAEAARAAELLEGQGYGVVVSPGPRRERRMRIEPAVSLEGHLAVPGDKSISHRSLLLGAVADGETHVRGFGRSADTESTLNAVRALGAEVEELGADELIVHGVGLRGLRRRTADRLRQRGHAGAAPARPARVPGGNLHADRRRVALAPADGAHLRAAADGWAPRSRRPTATCR